MANHVKASTKFLVILICSVAVMADPAQKTRHDSSTYNPQPHDFQSERLFSAYIAIQRFKRTITSDPKNVTATWTGRDICSETSYRGFYCAAPQGRTDNLTVAMVTLNGFGLHAPRLQGFVDQLPDLVLFHAASNSFGGDIPRLTRLTYPYKLHVRNHMKYQPADNGFYGHSVTGGNFGCVAATINFDFNVTLKDPHNGKGTHWATDSKALLLNHNSMSGRLPTDIGFSKLSYLALAHNKLTGTIPSSIEHLQDSLFEMLLLNNQLSGCLPHELGMLYMASVIDAGMNQLTGPIPSSFSCLSSVEQLNLAGNRLYGQVPDALCKLAGPAGRLANLTLSGNYFTSVGPACAALIKDGVLDVKNNCIPGFANQRHPAECAAFQGQPKTCPAASSQVACPAAATNGAATPAERKAREYSSYVTYATLHE